MIIFASDSVLVYLLALMFYYLTLVVLLWYCCCFIVGLSLCFDSYLVVLWMIGLYGYCCYLLVVYFL